MCAGITFRVAGGVIDGGAFTLEALVYPEHWYYLTLGSPLISIVTCVIVSLATQKISKPIPLLEPAEQVPAAAPDCQVKIKTA